MPIYNVYSPEEGADEDQGPRVNTFIAKMKKVVRDNPQTMRSAYSRALGSFTGKSAGEGSKNQRYTLTINDAWDAYTAMSLLTNEYVGTHFNNLPNGFRDVYELFKDNYPLPDEFINMFSNKLEKYVPTVTKGTRTMHATVKNPESGKMINVGSGTFRKVFKSIKLKALSYREPDHFNVKSYEVKDYCVPSYLQKVLSATKYNKIKADLEKNKTPTYPQLTKILNKVECDLNVYIIDGECIQEQNNFNKRNKLRILISDSHLYDLVQKTGSIASVLKNPKGDNRREVGLDEFNKLRKENTSYCESNEIIVKDIKYVRNDRFGKLVKAYGFNGRYSSVNVEFYENCFIRPSRYYDQTLEYVGGCDINQCYQNIIGNPDYQFAVQTGREETLPYKRGDPVRHTGFYYCTFKDFKPIDRAIFNSKSCWIMGYLIVKLGLKKRVKIEYQHVAQSMGFGQKTEHHETMHIKDDKGNLTKEAKKSKMLLTHFTGTLATHKTSQQKEFRTSDKMEKAGLLDKYKGNSCLIQNGVCVNYQNFKRTSGMYAYLSIISYAKYQLYRIHQEVNKIYDTPVEAQKIYTDSMAFDTEIDQEDIETINNALKKEGISVKLEYKKSEFKNVDHDIKYTGYDKRKITEYKKSDILKLLEDEKSFCINGKAGYGKTYELKNTIEKYFKKEKIEYMLTSSTIKNAEQIGGVNIHSILQRKDMSVDTIVRDLKKYKYIVVEEVSQLTMNMMNILDYLKKMTDIKIIFIGDIHQCSAIDTSDTWMKTKAFKILIDYNFVQMKWHKKSRYSREYDEFLSTLLDMFDSHKHTRDEINVWIATTFIYNGCNRSEEKEPNNKILAYKNLTVKEQRIENPDAICSTVHKAQGETIDENYSIYEWDRMPCDVLYTALSRASDKKNVTLCYFD